MATVQELITEALMELGVISAEETPETVILNRSLRRFKSMIGEWQLDGLPVPDSAGTGTFDTAAATLASQGPPLGWEETIILNLAVVLGPGHGKRPGAGLNAETVTKAATLLEGKRGRNTTQTAAPQVTQWAWIIADALQTAGAIREGEQASASMMARGLQHLTYLLQDWQRRGVANVPSVPANITEAVSLPDGYDEAVRLNLSVSLAPSYNMSKDEFAVALQRANESFQSLRRRNSALVTVDYAHGSWGWIIQQAFREISVIADGERMSTAQLMRGLEHLIEILEQWALSDLLLPGPKRFDRYEFTSTNIKQRYSIGPEASADIRGTPPSRLSTVEYRRVGAQEGRPLGKISYHDWSGEYWTGSFIPRQYYYEATHPEAMLWLDQMPTAGDSILLTGWADGLVPDASMLTVDVDRLYPPGYSRAFWLNLALDLAPSYREARLTETTAREARESKYLLKRRNRQPVPIRFDPGLIGRQGTIAYRGRSRRI